MSSLHDVMKQGAIEHGKYVEQLQKYMNVAATSRRGSKVEQRQLREVKNRLRSKSRRDDGFYQRCPAYEGPSPYYSNNPLVVAGGQS